MIDWAKPLRTWSGLHVSNVRFSDAGYWPVTADISTPQGPKTHTFTRDGYFHRDRSSHKYNLVNIQETTTMFDPSKPARTRHGHKARILQTGLKGAERSLVAVITAPDGDEYVHTYYADGRHMPNSDCHLDLVNEAEPLILNAATGCPKPGHVHLWVEKDRDNLIYLLAGDHQFSQYLMAFEVDPTSNKFFARHIASATLPTMHRRPSGAGGLDIRYAD